MTLASDARPFASSGHGATYPATHKLHIRHVLIDAQDRRAQAGRATALALAQAEADVEAEVELVVLRAGQHPASDICELPTQFLPAEIDQRTGRMGSLNPEIMAVLDSYRPGTLFHLHGGSEFVFLQLGRRLRRRGTPYLVTTHGAYAEAIGKSRMPGQLGPGLARRLLWKSFFEGAELVFVSSPAERDMLRGIASRSRLSPNWGVPRFSAGARPAESLAPNRNCPALDLPLPMKVRAA
ncbi:glycosyltransferase [Enterovirga sp. CN4-39]|uniref:glycosyltransferase n=1 Tax=Enterovirga sp. CN4-39 TaxID=3400910 RepID=UPI003C12230A